MVDRCVCCGEIIPEGRMVCYACEHSVEYNGINYDKSPIVNEKLKDREGGREMTWEIVAGIIALVGFIIGIMTPIIKLNTSITSLKCSIDALRTDLLRSDKRIDAHSLKLDDHEKRIIKLEDEKETKK